MRALKADQEIADPADGELAITRVAATAMDAFCEHPEFDSDRMRVVILAEQRMDSDDGWVRVTMPGGFRDEGLGLVTCLLASADNLLRRMGLPGLELEMRSGNPRRVGGRRPRPRSRK